MTGTYQSSCMHCSAREVVRGKAEDSAGGADEDAGSDDEDEDDSDIDPEEEDKVRASYLWAIICVTCCKIMMYLIRMLYDIPFSIVCHPFCSFATTICHV